MNVRHTLICFFFLYGNTGLITEGSTVITVKEGGNITHECRFNFLESQRASDKEDNGEAEPDRCSIEEPISLSLYVSITNLTKSDSGKYRCVLDIWLCDEEFEVRVEDDGNTGLITEGSNIITVQEGGTIRHECKFTSCGSRNPSNEENNCLIETEDKAPCDRYSIEFSPEPLYVSIRNRKGKCKCILDPLHSIDTFELKVEDIPSTSTPTTVQTPQAQGILLYMCLILVIVVLVSSTAVLIYCRKTANKPKGPPQETECTDVTEADRVYEEIIEKDGWSRSPPVEISTVYAQAKYPKPKAAEGTDEYSLVTAAQKETEDNSNKLTYSVVDLSNGAPASLSSAPPGDADNVVKSGPGVAANSDGHHDEHSL